LNVGLRSPGRPESALSDRQKRRVKDERQRVVVRYSGNVQGVGFRYTARDLAAGFDVCGTVRNVADGSVELVAEGSRSELDAFRQAIRDSGLGPLIRNEAEVWSEARGDLRGFQILR
jgi:acylphosphatase